MSDQEGAGRARYDVVVLFERPDTRIADGTAEALLRDMATRRIIKPVAEALHKDWVEVYCEPGPSAHEPFVRGTYEEDEPPFLEACVRWGTEPVELEDAAGRVGVYFYLEFRGCLFQEPMGPFRKHFRDVTYHRAQVGWRPHTELPPHKEVSEEDKRVAKERLKRGGSGGLAGTAVEEW